MRFLTIHKVCILVKLVSISGLITLLLRNIGTPVSEQLIEKLDQQTIGNRLLAIVVGLSQNYLDQVDHVIPQWFFSPNCDWFCGLKLSILELIRTFVTEEFDKNIESIILSFPELERKKSHKFCPINRPVISVKSLKLQNLSAKFWSNT